MPFDINTIAGLLLEAEVPTNRRSSFEARYTNVTGQDISPLATVHYQLQENKWGAELRVYFNDPELVDMLSSHDITVEERSGGYLSDAYAFRVNNNNFWWFLVETQGARLGLN